MKNIFILITVCLQFYSFSSAQINVMPYPSSAISGEGKFRLNKSFTISISQPKDSLLLNAANRMLHSLNRKTSLFFPQEYIVPGKNDAGATCLIKSGKPGNFQPGMDESYKLTVTNTRIQLDAPTSIGALRGMETLIQLLNTDEQGYYFPVVGISDKPRFGWRGLMIDVSRHFIPPGRTETEY